MKNRNKGFIITLFVFVVCILILTLYYTVFAKNSFKRKFEEEANFYYKGKVIEPEEIDTKNQKAHIELKGSFLKETTFLDNNLQLDFYLHSSSNIEGSDNNFVKIQITNTAKEDTNNNTLSCDLSSVYFNINDDSQKVYLDTISIPQGETKTYVFKVLKPGYYYYLDFSNKYKDLPISFDIEVTSAYSLEKLGVDKVTKTQREISYKNLQDKNKTDGERAFFINSGNSNNLELSFNNENEESYTLFLYDITPDVFDYKTMGYSQAMVKKYEIKPNTNFKETLTNTKAKSYKVNIVPTSLKEKYLNIQSIEDKIKYDDKKEGNIEKLKLEYVKEFEKIVSKQKSNFSYKLSF